MRRKIYNRLLQWKQEKDGSTALMIEGARRMEQKDGLVYLPLYMTPLL